MTRTMRRLTSLGVAAVAVTGLTVGGVQSAEAVVWNNLAPTKATNVTTVASKALSSGGTLQIRRGSYNGSTYYWARVASPGSKYNSGHDLFFYTSADWGPVSCLDNAHKDIHTTTYTKGTANKGCDFRATVYNRATGYNVASVSYYP